MRGHFDSRSTHVAAPALDAVQQGVEGAALSWQRTLPQVDKTA
jgi:hypothetical protein